MARYKAGIETRTRILHATQHLLSEVGFEGVTVKGICDAADIKAGSFYNLFPSKDEAVLTVIRRAITAVDPDPAGQGTDSIGELVDAYVNFVLKDSVMGRVYIQLAVNGAISQDHIGGRIRRHHEQRVLRFADALQRQRPDMSAEAARRHMEIFLAGVNGLTIQWSLDPTFDLRGHVDQLAEELSLGR